MVDCAYCGDFATDVDHVIPAAYIGVRVRGQTNLVPSCSECNTLLGPRMFDGVRGKAAYLAVAVRRRYRALLAGSDWSEDELRELSPTLRMDARGRDRKRAHVRLRLARIEAAAECEQVLTSR